jgi:hypothetical protein
MALESPITPAKRLARRSFLQAFGLAAPAALIAEATPNEPAFLVETAQLISPRDIYEISLEAGIVSLPFSMREAAGDPNSNIQALLRSTALMLATAHDAQLQMIMAWDRR